MIGFSSNEIYSTYIIRTVIVLHDHGRLDGWESSDYMSSSGFSDSFEINRTSNYVRIDNCIEFGCTSMIFKLFYSKLNCENGIERSVSLKNENSFKEFFKVNTLESDYYLNSFNEKY